jgi:hypothetical protein
MSKFVVNIYLIMSLTTFSSLAIIPMLKLWSSHMSPHLFHIPTVITGQPCSSRSSVFSVPSENLVTQTASSPYDSHNKMMVIVALFISFTRNLTIYPLLNFLSCMIRCHCNKCHLSHNWRTVQPYLVNIYHSQGQDWHVQSRYLIA